MDIVVSTPTFENYTEVIKYAITIGATWANGSKTIYKSIWTEYKENTCIRIKRNSLMYHNRKFYIYKNKNILTMNDFYSFKFRHKNTNNINYLKYMSINDILKDLK